MTPLLYMLEVDYIISEQTNKFNVTPAEKGRVVNDRKTSMILFVDIELITE